MTRRIPIVKGLFTCRGTSASGESSGSVAMPWHLLSAWPQAPEPETVSLILVGYTRGWTVSRKYILVAVSNLCANTLDEVLPDSARNVEPIAQLPWNWLRGGECRLTIDSVAAPWRRLASQKSDLMLLMSRVLWLQRRGWYGQLRTQSNVSD